MGEKISKISWGGLLFFVMFCLMSCGYYKEGSRVGMETMELDIGHLKFKNIPPVERTDPFILFSNLPKVRLRHFSAVMFRFFISCELKNKKFFGNELSEVFFGVWHRHNPFKKLVYVDESCPEGKSSYSNFDLFICPELNYLYSSGAQGTTSMSIRIRIFDRNHNLLWFVEHAGSIEYKAYKDYVFFSTESRMPASPEFVISYVLAKDLVKLLKQRS